LRLFEETKLEDVLDLRQVFEIPLENGIKMG